MSLLFPAMLASACASALDIPAEEAAFEAEQEAAGALQERVSGDPNFAGLSIEREPNFHVVVRFTGADPAAQLARYTRDPMYTPQSAAVSLAALERTQRDLDEAFQREQLHFMSSSVDVRANRVVIEVVSEDETRRALAARNIAIPDHVAFQSSGGVVASAQTMGAVRNFPQARYPAGGEMMALARGRLALVDGCLRLQGNEGGAGVLVVWPSAALLQGASDEVRVVNPATNSVVALGDTVELGGGQGDEVNEAMLTGPVPSACVGPYWFAGSTWRPVS
jgi:hypothetical protein